VNKNVAGQKVTLLAIDTALNTPKTGDAANLTAYVSKDDGAVTVLADTSATEVDATNALGLYTFDLAQAETNADKLLFSGKSSTAGIRLVPMTVYTRPANFSSDVIQTGDAYAIVNSGTHGNAALKVLIDTIDDFIDTEVAAIKAKTDNLPADPADASDIASSFTTVNTKLDTIDDFLDTEAAAILAAVDTEVAAILALLDDARTEPAQGAPPVNPDLATKIDYLYKAWRNKKDNDGAVTKLYADNGTTVDQKQNTSEAAGTVTKAEWITGP
jgi:hypothetical protein